MASPSSNCLLLPLLFILVLALSHVAESRNYYVPPSDCNHRCSYRCSATSHRKPCMFFCTKCCYVCHCVPPGTYGHKEVCPCYNNWKTKQGKPKCP